MSNTEKSQFLLLFRSPLAGPDPTPEEMLQIFGKWMAWLRAVKAKGQYVGGDRLDDAGKVVRSSRGASVTDGPYAEAKAAVGGYIIVSADSLENYHLLHAVRGHLWLEAGQRQRAFASFRRARELATLKIEQEHLSRRMEEALAT